MRILIVTDCYPPCNYGWGYMQLCEEVAEGLAARGHEIAVLTSSYRHGPEPERPYPVRRSLTIEPDWHSEKSAAQQFFFGRRRRERQAIAHLETLVDEFRPEVVFFWNTTGLPKMMLRRAEAHSDIAVVYYLAGYLPELPDEYIAYWQSAGIHPLARLVKGPLSRLALAMLRREGKPIRLAYRNTLCVSEYVRRRLATSGLIPVTSRVIYNGIDLDHFSSESGPAFMSRQGPMRLLLAGRVEPAKGVSTAVEAMRTIQSHDTSASFTLTILGDGDPGYLDSLRQRVSDAGLDHIVAFQTPVTREDMPQVLRMHDVLLLASDLEALSRSMMESMAMGLLVIGTNTGGSGELLVDGETGLVFPAGDAEALAACMRRAWQDRDLAARLASAGQCAVKDRFDIQKTITETENYLMTVAGQAT